MLKILIADDHAIVRQGLKQILADIPDLAIVDEASSGNEVLSKVRTNAYDVLILDISMPGLSGLDVLKQLKSEKPDINVLMLSMHPEEQYAIRALKAGAAGYLTKESAPEELIAAIKKVSIGRKYVTASLAEKLAFDLEERSERRSHEYLSDREFQVLCLIASGKTVKEIAEVMFLSIKTISTYRSRILEKMNMKTSAELTHYAIKNGLID
jgi:two-component system invasion response regulator UvrY